MIKSLVLLIFLLCAHLISFGQVNFGKELLSLEPNSIKEKVLELRRQGVDTIYTYYHYCTGCYTTIDSMECDGFLAAQIVWRMNGKTFSRKVNCKNSEFVIKESTFDALAYFIRNEKKITHRPKPKRVAQDGKTFVIMPYKGPVHHVGEQFHLIMGNKVYSSTLTEYLRDNVEKTKLGWVNATMKLADLNKEELTK